MATAARIAGNRIELEWVGGARGKPGINADIDSATEAVREIADEDFEVQGTNGVSSSTSIVAEGGVLLTTAGADNDQIIIVPHQDSNQTAWKEVTWGSDREVSYQCLVKTGTNIGNVAYVLGLKSDLDMGIDDADLGVFNFNTDDSDVNWGFVGNEAAGTVVDTDTGITVTINTLYKMRLTCGPDSIMKAFINDEYVGEQSFEAGAEDFTPLVGVQALSGAADVLTVYGQKIGRTLA